MKARATIGVLIGNTNSPYSMDLMHGIHRAAQQLDVNIFYYQAVHSGYVYRSYFGTGPLDTFDYQNNIVYSYTAISDLDALIIANGSLDIFTTKEEVEEIFSHLGNIPYVFMGRLDESMRGTSLFTDNYRSMYELVEHMVVSHGFRKITFLAGPNTNADSLERTRAVWDVMKKYDIDFDESHIAYGDFSNCVRDEIETLFKRLPDMELMICANDMMADTVYQICAERGLVIGKDIAVTGYDNWENTLYMDPPLTTVAQNTDTMGEMTVHCALDLLNGKQPEVITVPGRIIYRASSCTPHHPDDKDEHEQPEDFLSMSPDTANGLYSEALSDAKKARDEYTKFQQESWFIPLISRDMITQLNDEHEFHRNAVRKLSALRISRTWLFLFEEPIVHKEYDHWNADQPLFLAAKQTKGNILSYDRENAPRLTSAHMLKEFIDPKSAFEISVLCLYSEETQYGFLALEVRPEDLFIAYPIAMQIANALKYHHLSQHQQKTNLQLETLVQEVQEKNEVLSFLSAYDPLTGCFNRRGFIEKAVHMNHDRLGQNMLLLFADLDHLKDINDTFGHFEGDYAIRYCADTLRRYAGEDAIVGRLGGDEFAVLLPMDYVNAGEELIDRIKEANEEHNKNSDKPYYLEFSMGTVLLYCSEKLELARALRDADSALYSAKRLRRRSVRKESALTSFQPTQTVVEEEHNQLTGLLSSQSYFAHVNRIVNEVPDPSNYCLVTIDIEQFRMFNKWYGRNEGDRLLTAIGRCLQDISERYHLPAGYMGGDNFSVVLPYELRLVRTIQRRIMLQLHELASSSGFQPAFGIYPFSSGILPAMTMYDNAVIAQAKVFGNFTSRIEIYSEEIIAPVEKELMLISDVKEALENDQFTFYLQPQVDITSGRIIGAEALVRWEHPTNGMISPAVYIPVLEKRGFVADLDQHTWNNVCRWLRGRLDRGYPAVPVSINISRTDFFLMDVPTHMEALIKRYELPTKLLKLEVTESAYAENDDLIHSAIVKLRSLGFQVIMDDFGSGYSSMNMLKSVSVDAIKLDMRFLDITEETKLKGLGILETIVNLSRQLSLPIIVEGVENKQHLEFLTAMGCHYAQGYLFYRPMTVHAMEQLLLETDIIEPNDMWQKHSEVLQIGGLLDRNTISASAVNGLLGAAAIYEQFGDYGLDDIHILKINELYARLCGVTSSDKVGYEKRYTEHTSIEDRLKILRLFSDAYANPLTGSRGKLSFMRADGTTIPVQLQLVFLNEHNGHRQFIGIIIDLSES